MTCPCTLTEAPGEWTVRNPKGETLTITITEVHSDVAHELGVDPGLSKDGVEAHLQELLAANPSVIEDGLRLVYTFDARCENTGIAELLRRVAGLGIEFKDLHTTESSLEEIFVELVRAKK
jgi:RecB family endonuclease NucS